MLFNNVVLRCIIPLLDTPIVYVFYHPFIITNIKATNVLLWCLMKCLQVWFLIHSAH